MKIYKLDNLPSIEEYILGFKDIKENISKNQLCLLQKQYYSPHKIVTATQLAELAEIKGGRPVVNSLYGRLGHLLADAIGLKPNQRKSGDYNWWSILSSGYVNQNNFYWQMYDEVALALEALGWVNQKLDINNKNYLEIEIDNLLKIQKNQNIVFIILLDSIKHCHNCGSDKWAIYYKPDQYKIRVIVGNLIVLSIEKRGIWLALDCEILEENKEYQDYLEKIDTWTWDNHDYPSYSQVPSKNGYYNPSENYDYIKDWNIIKIFYFSFIKKACAKYSKINQKSKLNHQPEIIQYLCNCLKIFVPQPGYYLNKSFFTFPEELSDETEITNLYEGAKQSITVNRYERNNQARKKCIEYYGTNCYVCGFDFENVFGEIGKDFIHVHHLIPLSEINQEYEV
ncbi:MAG: hypothetical protein ACKPH7_10555, partial [Planktothrix sp.]